MGKRKTHEEFILEMKEINSNIEFLNNYNGAKTKILCRCKICNYKWYVSPNNLLHGRGCPKCSKNAKKTHDEFIYDLQQVNKNIIILGKYTNSKEKILCKCKIDNHEWYATPSSLLNGYGCPKCSGNAKMTHEEFINRLFDINPNIIVLDNYNGVNKKLLCKCKIDGHKWYAKASNLLYLQRGCPECSKRNKSEEKRLTTDEFQSKLENFNIKYSTFWITYDKYINNTTKMKFICKKDGYELITTFANLQYCRCYGCERKIYRKKLSNHIEKHMLPIEIIGEYENSFSKIKCICKICNKIFYTTPNSIISQNSIHGECAYYNKSKGEDFICDFLNKYNITFNSQQTFEDLKGVGGYKLRYDFYLPTYNILIEYQGKQHEEVIEYFGGVENFKKQQEHDKRKREYAEKYNIKLLEIWYWDFKNIEEILSKELNLLIA